MVKVNELLSSRFKKSSKKNNKMTDLAELSTKGSLSSFAGVFRITPLTDNEQEQLTEILHEYGEETFDVTDDLQNLSMITSEVKAINNQAAILHGERIKRAQDILKRYREGAFTSWLINTYGNRQTPYNFLQYFELYTSLPKLLQVKVDTMPRQAIYTLASRSCPFEEKEEVINSYNGETKREFLTLIRERFPLPQKDRRATNLAEVAINELRQLEKQLQRGKIKLTDGQKKRFKEVLQSLTSLL